MGLPNTAQDYWDLGADTERWWREHMRERDFIPHLRHTSCKGYDFSGSFAGKKIFVDVKFYTEPYNQRGWIEVASRGKLTGIFQTAKEHYYDPNTFVYLALLVEGEHWLYDVKELWNGIKEGDLTVTEKVVTDRKGDTAVVKSITIGGWEDPRYRIINGPLNLKYWKPQTAFGKGMDMNKWFKGEGI